MNRQYRTICRLTIYLVTMHQVGNGSTYICRTLPSVSNLSLTFRTWHNTPSFLDESSEWSLDALGSWNGPLGVSMYAAKLVRLPADNEPFIMCTIDPTYNLTMNESIIFPDVEFGFTYELRVSTVDEVKNIMQSSWSANDITKNSPDCYDSTRSTEYCISREVQTTGQPVDLRVDRITPQDSNHIAVSVSWAVPLQSNGVILFYKLIYRRTGESNNDKNGGDETISATKESGEWSPTVRYEYIINDVPNSANETYRLQVIPYVRSPEDGKIREGYNASTVFTTAQVEEPTNQGSGDLDISGDSEIPHSESTPPRKPDPDARQHDTDDIPSTGETPSSTLEGASTPGGPTRGTIIVTASVAAGLALAFVMSMVVVIWICFKRKKKEDELKKAVFIRTREEEISMYHHKGSIEKNETDYKECLPEFEVKELERTLLKLEKELGSGQFGVVYKGYAYGVYNKEEYSPVAIKSLKCNACMSMKQEFLDEIKLIIEIGSHPNILSVLGCCTVDEPYYLITEFMKYGDLLHFLWRCRVENRPIDDDIFCLTETKMIQIARQITRGMEYLSNTRYYHGDLAARNVLVGEDLVVKISDFGLADDIYQNGYKRLAPQRKRPVKWVSMETNLEGKCTIQSDVWSFGIVLYEIYTLGSMPYPGLDGRDVIRRLQTGYRMEQPDCCPDDIYDIMRQCWREKPTDRPTFTNLFNTFDKMLVAQCDYLPLEGAVYDHCIPNGGGNGGTKARGVEEEEEVKGAMATARRIMATDDDSSRNDTEESDTTRLFAEDEN